MLRELRVISAVERRDQPRDLEQHRPGCAAAERRTADDHRSARPARIETVTYQLQISTAGKPWRVYDDIALVPSHPRYGPAIVGGVAPLFSPDGSRAPALAVPGKGTTAELIAFGKRVRGGVVPEPVRLIELRDPAARRAAAARRLPDGGVPDGRARRARHADCRRFHRRGQFFRRFRPERALEPQGDRGHGGDRRSIARRRARHPHPAAHRGAGHAAGLHAQSVPAASREHPRRTPTGAARRRAAACSPIPMSRACCRR